MDDTGQDAIAPEDRRPGRLSPREIGAPADASCLASASSVSSRPPTHAPAAVLSLKQAMRRARSDDAERTGVVADLRAARQGRLEMLLDALAPLIAQIPDDADCFDVAIMPGTTPRLFVDMIGFVEMGRDSRQYRFLQDTRYGRVTLAESESTDVMVDAITHYVARRLLERDKALAGDDAPADVASEGGRTNGDRTKNVRPENARARTGRSEGAPRQRRSVVGLLGAVFAFVIDVLGAIAFFALLAAAGWVAWSSMRH